MATMRSTRGVRVIFVCLFLIMLAVIMYDPIIYIFGGGNNKQLQNPHDHSKKVGGGLASLAITHDSVLGGHHLYESGTRDSGLVVSTFNGTAVLRVMVLTFNRAESLRRCLDSLNAAEYDGFPVAVDIYLDLNKQKEVHNATLSIAKNFVFKHGPKEMHVRPRHVGVLGQWLQTWRVPRDNTAEIAVFVEDDITLSPYFARWLRRVHDKYDSYPGVNGYALQGESILHGVKAQGNLRGPPGQSVFLYPVLGSWGFSPKTAAWRHFISWYHEANQKPNFTPHVSGLMPSVWYSELLQQGRQETMWTMWHIFHAYQNNLYTLYPNLPERKGLAFNWKEPGEHYSQNLMGKGARAHLLETWREEDMRLPENLLIIDATGTTLDHKLTPSGIQ